MNEYEPDKKEGIFYEETAGKNFTQYLKMVRGNEKGLYLPKGFIPCSAFWLVDEKNFIGSVSFRHKLTPYLKKFGGHIGYSIRPSKRNKGHGKQMLALTLKKIRPFKLKKVLITCDEDNVGSQKVIQANGGILQDITANKGHEKRTMRWWIKL